jgi:hypothetical protein
MDRTTSSRAFRALLGSDAGRSIRENNGGDLLKAIEEGPLTSMTYTHPLKPRGGGGSPSVFVTVAGMREIMNGLPNADIAVKNRLNDVFSEYLNQSGSFIPLSFKRATPEQCAEDGVDEVVEEIISEGHAQSSETTMVITQQMWYDTRLTCFETNAEKRVLEAQLQAKDYVIAANESMKVAEIERERAEKELAQREMQNLKVSTAKDIQIAQLKMKLELAEEKARLRAEYETGRVERSEKRDKVQRVLQTKMHRRDTTFAKLTSVHWSNDDPEVNGFFKLNSGENILVWEPVTVMPKLTIRFSTAAAENYSSHSDQFKYRVFGFCFRGPAISESALSKSECIKEVYGVEVDGVHYVCGICYKRFSRPIHDTPTMPYAFGMLPSTIMADLIPGRNHHLTLYKDTTGTDDPVLEMLKRPSTQKWFWHSASSRRDI